MAAPRTATRKLLGRPLAARADVRRGRAADRDRRRCAAARRRDRRADLGEHPAQRQLRRRRATSMSGPPHSASTSPSQHWAADGLLAVFFFVAGIELKRELVAGDLRDPKAAALPVVAALCGMVVPALVYTLTNVAGGGSLARLGRAHGHRHRLRARRARRHRYVTARRPARLPAHARRRRRPLRDPDHRGLLHRRPRTSPRSAAPLVGLAVFWLLLRKGVRGLVRVRPARARHLGADVQQRHPRHHRRCRDGPDAALHDPHRGRGGALARRAHRASGAARCRPGSPYRCSPCSARVSRCPAGR